MTLPACLIPTRRTDLALVEARALRPGDVIWFFGHLMELDDVVMMTSTVQLIWRHDSGSGYAIMPKTHEFRRVGHLEGLRPC